MIKVVFTYRTKTKNLDELMNKFKQSLDSKFDSSVSNIKIERFKKVADDETFIVLDIYYKSFEDYQVRADFERSHPDWDDIWFNSSSKHFEVSVEVLEVM